MTPYLDEMVESNNTYSTQFPLSSPVGLRSYFALLTLISLLLLFYLVPYHIALFSRFAPSYLATYPRSAP